MLHFIAAGSPVTHTRPLRRPDRRLWLQFCLGIALALSAGGCADYRFEVNEKVVYNPDTLYSDYQIPDPELRACVEEHIAAESITGPSQLLELDCRDSDILSLQGLTVFNSLRYLNLRGSAHLPCVQLNPWYQMPGMSLVAPAHCPG